MSKKGSGYVRVKPRTQIAINMIAANMQLETGELASADDAIWEVIRLARPAIAEKAEAKANVRPENDGDEDSEE